MSYDDDLQMSLPYTMKHNPWVNKFTVLQIIKTDPRSILDVGCGDGFYGKIAHMFATDCILVGLDASPSWVRYVVDKGIYHRVIQGDASKVNPGQFDLSILGDVLEHLDYDDADYLLKSRVDNSKWVIVNGPLGFQPQDHEDSLEWHRCGISKDFFDGYVIEEFRVSPDNLMMNCLLKGNIA